MKMARKESIHLVLVLVSFVPVTFRRGNVREQVCDSRSKAKEASVRRNMVSLRSRQPANPRLVRLVDCRIEDTELDRLDVGGVLWCWAGRRQLGDGNFDIYSADLVGACVGREGRHRAQTGEVARHPALGMASCLNEMVVSCMEMAVEVRNLW